MESDIIQFLLFSLVIIGLGGANAYVVARGLPQVGAAYDAFWGTVVQIAPFLRRIFDPNTATSKALQAKGVNPQLADMIAEMAADKLEEMAKKYVTHS